MRKLTLSTAAGVLLLALILNSAYLGSFPSATIFYMSNVLLHLILGVALIGCALWLVRKQSGLAMASASLFFVSSAIGVYLAIHGNLLADRPVLWAHILTATLALLAFLPSVLARSQQSINWHRFRNAYVACLAFLVALPAIALVRHTYFPDAHDRVHNPVYVPLSMEEEGGGPSSPFWPSSTQTNVKRQVPSNFFLDSQKCGECHKEIYRQWESSMHHFASFNNQFYRKSIEYMQEVQGSTKPSQWCAACHDHAVIFSGRWNTPVKDQIDTREAQAGLGCVSCHAISHVDSSMGNAGFTMEYNALHDLAVSDNRYIKAVDHLLTYLNPEPHRRTFMKPFMRQDNSEYCSTCHKVHLDRPVNNYRWVRGFNEYDNWQASAVSGQGARSFYYPPKSSTCTDCHMQQVDSNDPGSRGGKIHSHYFASANTAVPYANRDEGQLQRTEGFLKSGFMRVDIFSASPVEGGSALEMQRRGSEGPQLNSTMAVGEESEQQGQVVLREVGKLAAPLDRVQTSFTPGSTVRVDVVVRTLKIGHFFPGGTVDAYDVWLELQGKDADGNIVYWSGMADDNGRGPVEKGAHFYGSYQLDGAGNMINKRNAWQTRSLMYVRLIPPGAADVAHFRMRIPEKARGPITLTAKLNYRKFAHYFTQFAYAGTPKPGQDSSLVALDHDSREFSFDKANIPANVSGAIKGEIPNIPTVTIAKSTVELPLGPGPVHWEPVAAKQDRERWNDWGIGLLLQGDLKGAEYAFQKVIDIEPSYSDGWLNLARALIQEGEMERAKPLVAKAIALNAKAGRNYYFKALIEKSDGDYENALKSLRTTEGMFPRDRVVLNQIGRILFLERQYAPAADEFQRVLSVDPEDVQAHYNLMLCYRGLGRQDEASREEKLFRRFKADESSQSISSKPRLESPEVNNSRQAIHDHDSVPLKGLNVTATEPKVLSRAALKPAARRKELMD